MKRTILFISCCFSFHLVSAQTQLDIKGGTNSTSPVAKILVTNMGDHNIVGLEVIANPEYLKGIAGSFSGGLVGVRAESYAGTGVIGRSLIYGDGIHGISVAGTGVYGESAVDMGMHGKSIDGVGVFGESTTQYGVHGVSQDNVGIYGQSETNYGILGFSTMMSAIYGQSEKGAGLLANSLSNYGAYISSDSLSGLLVKGGGGVAIEMEGANSVWGSGEDDAVVRTQSDQVSGDMILVSNDKIEFRLDDDNNSDKEGFKVYNGADSAILILDKFGNLDILGTLNGSSDRHRKDNLTPIDPEGILSALDGMPLYQWQYKGEDVKHIGPMAQDFHCAFQIGKNNKSIAMVDADGVALAAIKALHLENRKQNGVIQAQKVELAQLKSDIRLLKQWLEKNK